MSKNSDIKKIIIPACLIILSFFVFKNVFAKNLENKADNFKSDAKSKITNLNLTPEELDYLKNNPKIKISNRKDWIPFDFTVSGIPNGFGVDLIKLIFKRLDIEPEFVTGSSWNEILDKFYNNEIDIVHSIAKTKERENKAVFSNPYYFSRNVLIQRKSADEIKDFDDLKGKIIALPRGWVSVSFMRENYPDIYILEVPNNAIAFEYVEKGRAFATIEQKSIADYLIKKFGFTDLVYSNGIKDGELQGISTLHFAVSKENEILMSIIEKAFASITPEEINIIEKKWFGLRDSGNFFEIINLSMEEDKYLKNKSVIKYCVAPNKMPIEGIKNDRITGMSSDFIKLFEEKLKIKFELVPVKSWAETIEMVKSGKADIIPLVNKTPERSEFLLFTKSYLKYPIVIIASDKFHYISGLNDLKNKKIAVVKNSHIHEKIKNNKTFELVICENHQQALLKVSNKNADVFLGVLPVSAHEIKWLGISNLKIGGILNYDDELRVGVIKNDEILYSIMSKVVRSLTESEIRAVQDKWVSLKFEHEFDYSFLLKIGGFAGVLILIVLMWNRQLVMLNNKIKKANLKIMEKSKELELMSITDSLTGLFNRRYLENIVCSEILRFLRYNRPLSIMILDIDNFKAVNDTYGHLAGDRVLISVSDVLKNFVRKTDVSGRWGGEEFMVICPETDCEGGKTLAECLRKKIEELEVDEAGKVTISIGLTSYKKEDDEISFVKRADNALYHAKTSGKNRVVVY